jgi:MerR family redox-sensitive transcriptional activator SoxR
MKIGELSRTTGIPASTLRYYENEGLIAKPARLGGIRIYDSSVLDNLTIIGIAKAAGFSVAEIYRLLRGFSGKTPPSKRWRALAEKKLSEVEERMDQLRRMKLVLNTVLGCECPSFDDCAQASRRGRKI